MVEALGEVTLKSGERVHALAVRGPDDTWRPRLERLLAHKGEPWNWQNSALLTHDTGCDAWFYVLHRDGLPFAHQMTVEVGGVGLFGHVWTEPADRGQGAAGALMRAQMDHFRNRRGRCLILSTTHDSAAWHLYAKHGFTSIEPGSGTMTWTREPFADFAEGYLTARSEPFIENLGWVHWPACPVLFGSVNPGIVRCAPLRLFGRKTSEGELLPVIHRQALGLPGATVKVLRLSNHAVAGLAAAGEDPLAPDATCVDVFGHPVWTDPLHDLFARIIAPVSGRCTAYADPAQTGKIALLQRHGFHQAAHWPERLAAAAAAQTRSDLLMFERRQ